MGECSKEAIRLKERTAESFGFEWNKFDDVFAEYEDNFLSYIYPINKEFFKGKLVLDAGCGAGRHSYFASKYGAWVVGFDISEKAVESARKNISMFEGSSIYQSDIDNFWYLEKFDYIIAIGMLHHLPNPQQGFNKLVSLLKDGGTMSIWVYGKEDNAMAVYLYEPLRKITTKIPHKILYYFSFIPAVFVELCNRLKLPLFKHYSVFPFRTKWNDAFDLLSAPSAKYYTLDEISDWFNEASFKQVRVSYRYLNGVAKGIIGIGVK